MSGGGFVMVPDWLRAKKPSGNAVLAYINLGSFGTFKPGSGTYEECRPSLARLATEMGVSESTAKRALAELVEIGAAIRLLRFNKDGSPAPTMYRLVFGAVAQAEGVGSRVNPPPSTGDLTPRSMGGPTLGSRVNPNQEPSTQNPVTKNKTPRCEAAVASSSGSQAAEDDPQLAKQKQRRMTKAQRDRQHARDVIAQTGYDHTPDEIEAFFTSLRDNYGVRNLGPYCQRVLDDDGEDKLADLIADAWVYLYVDNAA